MCGAVRGGGGGGGLLLLSLEGYDLGLWLFLDIFYRIVQSHFNGWNILRTRGNSSR